MKAALISEIGSDDLTLTSVVFESQNQHSRWMLSTNLTLTSVVFESANKKEILHLQYHI